MADLPPLFDMRKLNEDEPSAFTRAHYAHIDQEIDYKSKKLLATHTTKEGAKTWCQLLGYFLNKGYTISNVKNIFTTRLEAAFKPVIELIAQARTEASRTGDKVAKALCKQILVSLYGKQGENVTKYEDHEFVCVENYEDDPVKKAKQTRELQKKVANPKYKGFDRLADDSVALHYSKNTHKCDKNIASASFILDMAKLQMFEFSDRFKANMKRAGADVRIVKQDTDCFFFNTFSDDPGFDLYKELAKMQLEELLFDTHENGEGHPAGCSDGLAKQMGLFADELEGMPCLEFITHKAKVWSLRRVDGSEEKKSKGVPGNVLAANATHELYKTCLLSNSKDNNIRRVDYASIDSHKHSMYTQKKRRIMLSVVDNKRHQIDSVHSLPYGMTEDDVPPLKGQTPAAREAFVAKTDCRKRSYEAVD